MTSRCCDLEGIAVGFRIKVHIRSHNKSRQADYVGTMVDERNSDRIANDPSDTV